MITKKRTSITLDEHIQKQAQLISDQESRSLSQTIEMLLRKYITNYHAYTHPAPADLVMTDIFPETDHSEMEVA